MANCGLMDPFNPTIDELQLRFERLSPAPRIAGSLRSLVAEGNVNPDDILALVRLEPLLAARIIREANQMPHRQPSGYASIEEAATAIGFQRLYDLLGLYAIAPASSSAPSFSTATWKQAITCATCMESLAEKHRLDPQRAYAIGLLHSLAAAIIESVHPAAAPAAKADPYQRLNYRLKGYNASGLCAALLADWGFPSSVADPIRYQYAPLDCQTTGKTACLLNLAKWITGVVRETDELPDQEQGPDVLVLNLLGEGEQTLWNLVTEVSDSLHRADSILQGKFSAC